MNRNIKILIALLVFNSSLLIKMNAQVGINQDNSSPDATTMLDVKSTTLGVLIPRMTSAERLLITPTIGLMVYDTDLKSLVFHDGTAWMSFRSAIQDKDGDTGIYVEMSTDEDKIRVVANDTSSLIFERTGDKESRIILQSNNDNTLIGWKAGDNSRNISESILIGKETAENSSKIEQSVIIGYQAGANKENIRNVIIGDQAGFSYSNPVSLTENVLIGYHAGRSVNEGKYNVAIGRQAMGSSRTLATVDSNTVIGRYAANFLETGNNNVVIGSNSGTGLKSGSRNIIIGYYAGATIDDYSDNIAIGYQSGRNMEGNKNIALGDNAIRNIESHYNIGLGYQAGYYHKNTTKSIFIGHQVGEASSSNLLNRDEVLYIGHNRNNPPLIFGSFAGDTIKVNGDLNINDVYTFPNTDGTTGQVLQTDGNGNLSWGSRYPQISLTNNILGIAQSNVDLSGYLETLSLNTNTLSLSNGSSVNLSSLKQTLSYSNNTLSLSNGSSVDLNGVDNLGNHIATQNLQLNDKSINYDTPFTLGIENDGRVGMGGVSGNSVLYVSFGKNRSTPKHGKLVKSGGGTGNSQTRRVSILATQGVVADVLLAISDERVKNVKGISNNLDDLKTLNKIEIVDYSYKDTIANDNIAQKKVIAQQVKTVFSQVVDTLSSSVIPDIMQTANINGNWVKLEHHSLKKGERVKMIFDNDVIKELEILEVKENAFRIKLPSTVSHLSSKVFIYGRRVKDFHTVDYDGIGMLNVSATQALYRQGLMLENENQQLQSQIQQLEKQLAEIQRIEVILEELEGK